MEEWQEILIFNNIKDLIDGSEKSGRNSWTIREGLHACFCMLYTLHYLSREEFLELSQLADEWAIKWNK